LCTTSGRMPYVSAVATTSAVSRDPSSRLTTAAALPSPLNARARRGSTPIWSVSLSRHSGRSPAFNAGLIGQPVLVSWANRDVAH
jgi:hypothetical protein